MLDDLDSVHKLEQVEDYKRFVGELPTREHQKRSLLDTIARFESRGWGVLGVNLLLPVQTMDLVVGICGLIPSQVDGETELICALHTEHWGRGYAHEACSRVLRWAFDDLGFTRIIGRLVEENVKSIRLVEGLGMRLFAGRKDCQGNKEVLYAAES